MGPRCAQLQEGHTSAAGQSRRHSRWKEVEMRRRVVLGFASLPLVLGLGACQSGSGGLTDPTPPAAIETPSGGTGGGQSTALLLGEWQLVSLQKAGQAAVTSPAGHTFSADFTSEGRVHMAADCNRCFAEYSAAPGTIEVGLTGCTLAYCVTAPLDTDFAGLVSAARQWSVSGEELTLSSEDGTLVLQR
jgi:heat shock protein HslJ